MKNLEISPPTKTRALFWHDRKSDQRSDSVSFDYGLTRRDRSCLRCWQKHSMRFGRPLKPGTILAVSFFQWTEKNPNQSVVGCFLVGSVLGPGIEVLTEFGLNYDAHFPIDIIVSICHSRFAHQHGLSITQSLPPLPQPSFARILVTTIRDVMSISLAFVSCVWLNVNVIQALRFENYRNFMLQFLCYAIFTGMWIWPLSDIVGCASTYFQFFDYVQRVLDSSFGILSWMWSRFYLVALTLIIVGYAIRAGNYVRRHVRVKGIRREL